MKIKVSIIIVVIIAASPLLVGRGLTRSNSSTKESAFTVLRSKCNVCHRKQNPGKVFSRENMDHFAPKIYKQVFVKKRMPKGRVQLTEEERQSLLLWLKTQPFFEE